MKSQQLKLGFLAYLATVVAWIVFICAVIFLLSNSQRNLNLKKDWLPFLLILGALVTPTMIITWSFVVEMTTTYSRKGITRLTLCGRKQINWIAIESLQISVFYVDIRLARGIYRIPLLMYKDPKGLVNYIREQHIDKPAKQNSEIEL